MSNLSFCFNLGKQAIVVIYFYLVTENEREVRGMIKDFLTNKTVEIQAECYSWKEVIRQVGEPLVVNGSVEASYIDAMIKSCEKYGAYMLLTKHFALVHARPEEGVNRLAMSALTLKYPVVFGHEEHDPVKLVVCVATPDATVHLELLKEIIGLVSQPDKVGKLTVSQSVDEFLSHIEGEENNHEKI